LMATFHSWMDRLQACIDGGGEYVEWAPFYNKKLSLGSTPLTYDLL
jgi:hypothetical protein